MSSPARSLRRRAAGALAALAIAATAAVFVPAGTATAASDSTLTIGIAEHGANLNPFTSNLDPDLNAVALIYPTLVWPDPHGTPTHYLADKWDTSSDKLTWTFHLHPGLKWTDGKPITAADVAWTLNLIMHNAAAATLNGALVANFASVTAPDETTVVIKTKEPQANMLYIVGLPIVPQHVWEDRVPNLLKETGTGTPLVGYGPFELKQYQTDGAITMTANKDFFLGAPGYDTLVLQTYKDINPAVLGLKNGDVDQVDKLEASDYKALQGDDSIYTYQQVGYRWTAVEINPGAKSKTGKPLGTGNPILGDATVRKAIAYGIDRATLVKKVLQGLGQVGSGYLPPAFPEFSWKPSPSETVGYDPDKANQLLDQAGYAKGSDGIRTDPDTGKALSFRLGTHTDDVGDTSIASFLVSWMKAIGIKLNIEPMSNTALNANLAKGDWDMLMDGWGTGPDPTYLLSIQTCGVLPDDKAQGGQTDAFFCDKKYDELFAKQQQTFDPTERADIIKQMEEILYAANDDIILYYQNDLAAIRNDAKDGFIVGSKNGSGFYPFQNAWSGYVYAKPSASSDSSSSNTGLIIGIVVAVVVVAGVVAFVLLRRRATAADRM